MDPVKLLDVQVCQMTGGEGGGLFRFWRTGRGVSSVRSSRSMSRCARSHLSQPGGW